MSSFDQRLNLVRLRGELLQDALFPCYADPFPHFVLRHALVPPARDLIGFLPLSGSLW